MEHVKLVGGWYLEDREYEITPRRVMKMIEVDLRPALGLLRPDAPREPCPPTS